MATFGRFETVREIHRTGYTTVYTGRAPDSDVEKFAIKVFQPSALLLETGQAKTEIDLFLKSIEPQQKAAAGGAQHWAPVHQHGSTTGGAFYVTDKYEHSLQQMIDIRLKLSSKVLSVIVESVARGLMELKESCRRPHGNLKATNVLISGTEDISQGKIVLSDPLPEELIDTEVHWDNDLRVIAELIYQLVVHRQSPRVEGWQAPETKEWRSLGRNAASWRNLCNRLLNASAKPGTITIETVLEELAQLKTAEPLLSPRRLIAAALIVVVCVVALVIFWPRGAPATVEEWKRLCNEYLAWVGDLYEKGLGLNRKQGNSRAQRWSKDQHLKTILKSIKAAGYPYEFAKDEGMELQYILDTPGYDSETKKGLSAIEDIKSFFNPDSNSPWPLLSEMQETAKRFGERGWEKPAQYLVQLVGSVRPEPNQPIAENVDKLLNLKQENTLEKIDSSQKQITKDQAKVKSLNDPIFNKFDDEFVNREVDSVAGADNKESLDRLQSKLEEISSLGRNLAGFIEDKWEKEVDQQSFLDDHGNDTTETVTNQTFVERLAVIRGYCYLRPDPRETVFKLVGDIEGYIRQAQVSNPREADACAKNLSEFGPNIEEIKKIKAIEKNRTEIEEKIGEYKPKLVKLKDRALRAIETAKEYWDRITKLAKIARSEEINTKWKMIRDGLLQKYPLPNITKNLEVYSELRHKIDDVNVALVKLDEELLGELPFDFNVPMKETGWNSKVKEAYGQQRKQTVSRILQALTLREDIPDLNAQEFNQSKQAEFTAFKQLRNDLTGTVTAFNAIEDALDACYLLDDQMPEKVQDLTTIRTLWTKFKDNKILEQPMFTEAFTTPVTRITEFESLDSETDRQVLTDKALAPTAGREIKYAAWTRLGSLSAPPWPNDSNDMKKDRAIRNILKTEFEAIKLADQMRGDFLLTVLVRTAIERETIIIQKNSSQDKVLAGFGNLAVTETRRDSLPALQQFEDFAKTLADFVSNPDWPQQFRADLLAEDQSQLYNKSNLTTEDFRYWLSEVTLYKKLEQDPRTKYSWNAKIAEITKLIEDELDTKQDGSSKQNPEKPGGNSLFGKISEITRPIENAFRSKKDGPSKENLAKLEQEYNRFAVTVKDVENLLAIPAIEKNKDRIETNICNDLWKKLQDHEAAIRAIIKPEYCKYLDIVEGKVRHLAFAGTTEISKNFEPVNITYLQSSNGKKTLFEDLTKFIKGTTDSILSLTRLTKILNKLPLSEAGEFLNKTVEIAGWDEIRQAVKDKQIKWLDFFHTIDLSKTQNVGWPKYIVSKKDPSLILRFIPASAGNPEPFYMAIHEISNSQYRLFLEKDGAKRGGPRLQGWSIFTDQSNKTLIQCTAADKPPCAIQWDQSGNVFTVADAEADAPVTWVTYNGAQSYSRWLGGQLPTTSQHEYACRAGTGNITPWGNDRSQIAAYAHVRGAAYQKAATVWNREKDTKVPPLPVAPVGAVEDYQSDTEKTLDETAIVHNQDPYQSVWPVTCDTIPNTWGLYNMIGNVWEWCKNDTNGTQSVICGGSCVSPPKYIFLDSPADYRINFNEMDNDVGFRVIVPAK
ncbi:MAG: SUMF1/EgtB/PvdO family nonheme iron enzyme [Phycisphaerae bacterium]|nr:SUMF1/EgtB/PvdO family nonheme iron enzyme [Phycisphaerae bacterium]NIP53162.1 SUMF1/EgtB/PvdO family nonheme iron enzyme [Phycisphaerae bacterium]NIS52193.1 SUMF1/EgtB/PvdO family nonheme iron enzyme [Phycisphaerae bacterium]NIU09727.1 SUMF1/EgtB/PvdO family nonheme iron enzyme [Phycisphaerae bacterium]NIU57399.1 SUMF1/EgtB/PvdO family nonheme iron enzyme [Phycisphaerae bacterium]